MRELAGVKIDIRGDVTTCAHLSVWGCRPTTRRFRLRGFDTGVKGRNRCANTQGCKNEQTDMRVHQRHITAGANTYTRKYTHRVLRDRIYRASCLRIHAALPRQDLIHRIHSQSSSISIPRHAMNLIYIHTCKIHGNGGQKNKVSKKGQDAPSLPLPHRRQQSQPL